MSETINPADQIARQNRVLYRVTERADDGTQISENWSSSELESVRVSYDQLLEYYTDEPIPRDEVPAALAWLANLWVPDSEARKLVEPWIDA